MSRNLSAAFRAQLHARAPGDGAIQLLRISHADFGTLYYCPDVDGIVSNGQAYGHRWFSLPLPSDEDGAVESNLKLDITDLDDDVVDAILDAAGDRPVVECDVVSLSAPDTVEATFYFQMKTAEAPVDVLDAVLSFEPLLALPWPGFIYDGARNPDLFL